MSVGISNYYTTSRREPAFSGSKALKRANGWKKQLNHIRGVRTSPVPYSFVEEMAKGIDSLGPVGKKVIKKQNLKYVLAQKTTDAFPELKGLQPRGWSKWLTIDGTNALSMNGIIGLFEKPTSNPPANMSSVRHETGHELHRLFNKIIGIDFTDTKGYTEAYLKDITNLSENLKKYGKKVKNVNHYISYITGIMQQVDVKLYCR